MLPCPQEAWLRAHRMFLGVREAEWEVWQLLTSQGCAPLRSTDGSVSLLAAGSLLICCTVVVRVPAGRQGKPLGLGFALVGR